MFITIDSHNFLLLILQRSIAYTQKLPVPLQHTTIRFQMQYAILLESVFLSECLKLSLPNFMNTPTPVSKSTIILSPNTILFLIFENVYPFSYTVVLNVNAIKTSI